MCGTLAGRTGENRSLQTIVQIIHPLLLMAQPVQRPVEYVRVEKVTHALPQPFDAHPMPGREALIESTDAAHEVVSVGRNQFSGHRRRRSSNVSHEIRDREVGLVTHCTDDRYLASGNGPGDGFFVECPQILERTAATTYDQDIRSIGSSSLAECVDRPGDPFGSAHSLHSY